MSTRKATLKDVAKACGVTPMTVSKYLNKKGGVGKDTGLRIAKAIKDLKYTPNLLAKSLREQKTHTIGIVVSDSTEWLFSRMLRGVDHEAFENGYMVITSRPDWNLGAERERECISMILAKQVDGLLVAAPRLDSKEIYSLVKSSAVPTVLVFRDDNIHLDCIAADNEEAGRILGQHFAQTGAKNIRFFNLPPQQLGGQKRLDAFRKELRSHGIQLPGKYVLSPHASSIEEGYRLMRELLTQGDRPDALCCMSDLLAIGAMQALGEAGIAVPEQIRVSGFDDIPTANHLAVPLTTMRKDLEGIGRQAVRILLRRIANPTAPRSVELLPCTFIKRRSI